MNYSVSQAGILWKDGVFPVPCAIVSDYLNMASGKQIKALLLVLNNFGRPLPGAQLAEKLKITEEELSEIMDFWICQGIVLTDGACPVQQPIIMSFGKGELSGAVEAVRKEESPSVAVHTERTKLKPLDVPRLTHKDIVARCSEDDSIRFLLNEAQLSLGRSISVGEQEMLVNMVDYYGLLPEVILMILDYAKSVKKVNITYISAIAKNWGEEGIDTLEKAEEKLNQIGSAACKWNKICVFGGLPQKSPTVKQMEYVTAWTVEMGFQMDVIEHAFEIAKNNEIKRAVPYVNGILTKWNKLSLRTLSDVLSYENGQNQQRSGDISTERTYDIDEIDRDSILETLNFGG